MPEGCFATFQACQNPNSIVDADICLTVLWAPTFALGPESLQKLTTTTMVQKETRIIHSNGRAVTMLPALWPLISTLVHRIARRDGMGLDDPLTIPGHSVVSGQMPSVALLESVDRRLAWGSPYHHLP